MASVLLETDRPASALTAALDHLVLTTPDPNGLAAFYHRALGYRTVEVDGCVAGSAADRRLLFVPGPERSLAGAGFALADAAELDRLRERIDRAGWPREDGPAPFFFDAVSVRDPDGTTFTFGLRTAEAAPFDEDSRRSARIQHVVMASRDPDRVVAFFVDVLGFTLSDNVVDDEGGVRTSFLRCSREHHSFAVFKAAENRLDHHCYEVADWNAIRDWSDHFSAERIRLQWGPGRHGPGNNLFIFLHDPDGNWVELSAELEIVSHDRPVGNWPHEERTLNSWGQGKLRS